MFIIKTEKNIRLNGNKVYLGNDLIFGEYTEEKHDSIVQVSEYGGLSYRYDNSVNNFTRYTLNGLTFRIENQNPIVVDTRRQTSENGYRPSFPTDDFDNMFEKADITQLIEIPSAKDVYTYTHMFYGCDKLKGLLDLKAMGIGYSTSNTLHVDGMFQKCANLEEIRLGHKPIAHSYYQIYCDRMFAECTNLRKVDLSDFEFKRSNMETYGDNLFQGCNKLEEITLNNCTKETINFIKEQATRFAPNVKIITNTVI